MAATGAECAVYGWLVVDGREVAYVMRVTPAPSHAP